MGFQMRWLVVTCAALLLAPACGLKSVTKEDRVAASVELSKRKAGSQVSDRELAMADQDKTVVCTDDTPVGSHIPKRRCRTMREIEEEKRRAQENHQGGCMEGGDLTGAANVARIPCAGK
jgi:hypothetical protein